ncbi:MAG: translocation/assembly module TamB domain-containing protein [Saprospiraceae bacterium]
MENKEEKVIKTKSPIWRKALLYLLLLFILIPIVLFFVIQIPTVQNKLVDYITCRVTATIDGEVSIDHVSLDINDGLQLEGFRLVESSGDTIISASSLDVDLASSLYSLLNNKISIKKIKLQNPKINIVKLKDSRDDNLTLIIKALSSPNEKSSAKGNPLNIDLHEIFFEHLQLNYIDYNTLNKQEVSIVKGVISVDSFLKNNLLDISKIILDKPIIRLSKIKGDKNTGVLNSIDINSTNKENTEKDSNDPIQIKIGALKINEGFFSFHDYNKRPISKSDIIDYAHMEFSKINIDVSDFDFSANEKFTLDLNNLSFKDDKGFEVKKLVCSGVKINPSEISFPQFEFITDRTYLKESLKFTFKSYDDLSNFEKKVNILAKFRSSKVYLGDLLHFIAKLNTKDFFIQNKTKIVSLAGNVSGTIDQLVGDDMKIRIGDEMVLDASFSTHNLTLKNRELVHINIKNLDTDMAFIKSFIPGFTPPQNFYKLGRINFKGLFDGFLKDFVAYGNLKTAMGGAFLDMRLDTKEGKDLAHYSGEMNVVNFNLKEWTENEDFGHVDFSASIIDGRGLTLNSVYSDLFAVIERIDYKGYVYEDFEMDAQVDKDNFNGEFTISDDNIDLIFDGNVEMKDNVPYLDFKANIGKINLFNLNLSTKPLTLKGNVDMNVHGRNLNDFVGNFIANDLIVFTNDSTYILDTIALNVFDKGENNRKISLFSDIAKVDIEGEYDLELVVPATMSLLKENYPHYTQNWKVRENTFYENQNMIFEIEIFDSQNFMDLLGVRDFRLKNFSAVGHLNTKKGDLSFISDIPILKIKNNSFWGSKVNVESNSRSGNVSIIIDSTAIGNNIFSPISIGSQIVGDSITFMVNTENLSDSVQRVDIQGVLLPNIDGYQVNITNNKIEALGGLWTFDLDNRIVIGNNYLDIDNLILSDGNRTVAIDDIANKGLSVAMSNFNFLTINGLIDYDKMKFEGQGDINLSVSNLFQPKDYKLEMSIEDFTINSDSFGPLDVNITKDGENPVNAFVAIGQDGEGLVVDGTIDTNNDNYIDLIVKANDFPLRIFEYLLKDGIKKTHGGIDLNASVKGKLKTLDIDGVGYLDGGVTVVYTGVDYIFDDEKIFVDQRKIDLTGVEIIDTEGGISKITGGLKHDLFDDFELDAVISGKDVVALNTTKYDNPLYYGYGKGDVSATFTGPFHLVNIKIVSTTKDGSILNIPIWEGESSTDKNFIQFIKKEEILAGTKKKDDRFRFEGLDVEIDLTLTPAARVNIIFDESRGDIIEGNGRGNMKMHITRYGDFDMYGTYDIEKGKYLFTAIGAVAKPFKVRRGGQIKWTGDPINAVLDIQADYEVRTTLEVFLSEFVTPASPLELASRSTTQVDLILNLGGTLFHPQVNFDLNFPDIDGELRTTADSKMRTLRANQTELNSQVLGLIVFNSFLPSSGNQNVGARADIGSTGIGTLSEFVSSQLSLLFTGLLNEALADNGLISGIDFDIGLRKTSLYGVQQTNSKILPDEIEVHLKNRFKFLDERLSLDLGGNYVRDNVLIGGDYFIGNFVLEYFLSDNRKLKLRMYGRYDYDEFYRERRQKYGIGLGYRTEFGSLSDFKETMSRQFRDEIKQSEND